MEEKETKFTGFINRDDIHWNTRTIDGYQVPFNFAISEREPGKSTAVILDKIYKPFREYGYTTLVIRRNVNDITSSYIEDFAGYINKFSKEDEKIAFIYRQSDLKDGIVDVKLGGKIFLRVIGLSKKIASVKSLMLPSIHTILFDEFICNPEFDEKYLKNEAIRFMEIYNTFRREGKNLRVYFLGNPYSHYNPYFLYFNINTRLLKRGAVISDKKTYVIECIEMNPLLREKILKENPLYQFDNAYTRYAFGGTAINDEKIRILETRPQGFPLRFVFHIEGKFIALYKKQNISNIDLEASDGIIYYCGFISLQDISRKRDIYCFDFGDLVDRTALLSNDDKWRFSDLKHYMRERKIVFENINCYYLFEEIFYNI